MMSFKMLSSRCSMMSMERYRGTMGDKTQGEP
jgi:hypothetical protein